MNVTAAPHTTPKVLRWSSTSGPTQIAELIGSWTELDELAQILSGAACDVVDCAALIVSLAQLNAGQLAAAVRTVHSANVPLRICFAVDESALAELRLDCDTGDKVGFLLDNVNDRTSLADVAHEGLEAVRFQQAFAHQAANELRSGCVLDAMLYLARDIGLCTLGPTVRSSEWLPFDYVPARVVQ